MKRRHGHERRGTGASLGLNPLTLTPSIWFDFSDLTTLFQDTGATSPVTTSGQKIARANDLSGNGYHATQSNSSNRPLYSTTTTLNLPAAEYEIASNQYLSTPTLPLATLPLTLFFAGKSTENSISDQQVICYLSGGIPGWLLNQAGYQPGVGVGNPYAVAVGAGGYPGDICLAAGIQAETPVWAATYNPATTPAVNLYSGGSNNNPNYLINNLIPNQAWNNNSVDIGGNVSSGFFFCGFRWRGDIVRLFALRIANCRRESISEKQMGGNVTTETLALVSLAISTTVAFVGALVRTLYQRDSDAQREAINELKRKIELLESSDSKLSERVHSQENKLTEIFVTLKNIENKIDSLVSK